MQQIVHFGEFWQTRSLGSNSVTRFLIGERLVENAKIAKIQMRHIEQKTDDFSRFQARFARYVVKWVKCDILGDFQLL